MNKKFVSAYSSINAVLEEFQRARPKLEQLHNSKIELVKIKEHWLFDNVFVYYKLVKEKANEPTRL